MNRVYEANFNLQKVDCKEEAREQAAVLQQVYNANIDAIELLNKRYKSAKNFSLCGKYPT